MVGPFVILSSLLNAKELRDAAKLFTELAEYLEEQK